MSAGGPLVNSIPRSGVVGHRLGIITPARDESAWIGKTIDAVLKQTLQPARWLIISDGSTDATAAIVQRVAREHRWIELLVLPHHDGRDYAAKARAFNTGWRRIQPESLDYIANLDADVTFDPDYFEFILGKFEDDPALGVAGTPYVEYAPPHAARGSHGRWMNRLQVPGACQFFRRACLDEIAGYVPVASGAIDSIATTSARMKGWHTAVYSERHFVHLGHCNRTAWRAMNDRFRYGKKAYLVGGHPVWELSRGFYGLVTPPYLVGGLAFLTGFTCAALLRRKRPVSAEFVAFHRAEQINRWREGIRTISGVLGRAYRRAPTRMRHAGNPVASRLRVDASRFVVAGRWPRTAEVFDEIWSSEAVSDPASIVHALAQGRVRADLFTFTQRLPDVAQKFPYHCEWERLAVVEVTDFQHWWSGLAHASQSNLRKAARCGVTVGVVEFGETLVRQMKVILDETPVRHGMRFRHFRKGVQTLKSGFGTYADRSIFIGPYLSTELIGFLKMVVVGDSARIMHLLSYEKHRDKRTNNALLAGAVAECANRSIPYLIYDQYTYRRANDSLTEFKRRNGFRAVIVPRYYVPLTRVGRLALALGLHRGVTSAVPGSLIAIYRVMRAWWNRGTAVLGTTGRPAAAQGND